MLNNSQYPAVLKERDELCERIKVLEKENASLKATLLELSSELALERHRRSLLLRHHTHLPQNHQQKQQENENASNILIEDGNQFPTLLNKNKNLLSLNEDASLSSNVEQSPVSRNGKTYYSSVDEKDCRGVEYEAEIRGHTGAIFVVSPSPDGKWLASGSLDKSVRLWTASKPYQQVACLTGHTQLISSLCWDNQLARLLVISTSYDKTVRIWDAERAICLHLLKLPAFGIFVCSIPRNQRFESGLIVALTMSKSISIFDMKQVKLDKPPKVENVLNLASLEHDCHPISVSSLSIDGKSYLVVGDEQGVISLYDVEESSSSFQLVKSQKLCKQDQPFKILNIQTAFTNVDSFRGKGHSVNKDNTNSCIVGVQCSDNCIRIYSTSAFFAQKTEIPRSDTTTSLANIQKSRLESPVSASSQLFRLDGAVDQQPEVVTFLFPLRTLRGHICGEWPVGFCFFRGFKHVYHSNIRNAEQSSFDAMSKIKSTSKSSLDALWQEDKVENGFSKISIKVPESSSEPTPYVIYSPKTFDTNSELRSPNVQNRQFSDDIGYSISRRPSIDDDGEFIGTESDNIHDVDTALDSRFGKELLQNENLLFEEEVSNNSKISWDISLVATTGSMNGTIYVYDLSSLDGDISLLYKIPSSQKGSKLYGAVFNTSQANLISYSSDGSMKVWNLVEKQ